MPPLSLTQSKNAFAVFGVSVKSVPGCLVAIAPSLIGAPVAFCPVPAPHFTAAAGAAVLAGARPGAAGGRGRLGGRARRLLGVVASASGGGDRERRGERGDQPIPSHSSPPPPPTDH